MQRKLKSKMLSVSESRLGICGALQGSGFARESGPKFGHFQKRGMFFHQKCTYWETSVACLGTVCRPLGAYRQEATQQLTCYMRRAESEKRWRERGGAAGVQPDKQQAGSCRTLCKLETIESVGGGGVGVWRNDTSRTGARNALGAAMEVEQCGSTFQHLSSSRAKNAVLMR